MFHDRGSTDHPFPISTWPIASNLGVMFAARGHPDARLAKIGGDNFARVLCEIRGVAPGG
jgi:hypothetical protein